MELCIIPKFHVESHDPEHLDIPHHNIDLRISKSSIKYCVPPISRTNIMCRSPWLLFVGSGISKGKHEELVLIFSCKFWNFDRYLSYGRVFVRWFPSEIPWKSACKKVKMPGKPHYWGILRTGSLTHWEGVSALGIFWKKAQLPGLKHEKNSF